jgi:hypothetical protein
VLDERQPDDRTRRAVFSSGALLECSSERVWKYGEIFIAVPIG